MTFKRVSFPSEIMKGEALTRAMVGIGMNFAASPMDQPNIEDTLLAASREGMEGDDLRVLALLTQWLGLHASWINVDRLSLIADRGETDRVHAFWSGVAQWQSKDRRFARLARVHEGPRLDLLRTGTAFHINRSGEDPRFAEGPLRVPAGVLRDRPGDVLSPSELARLHETYRRRILLGPSYRADMWAELERDPTLSASELARRAYGSFATAWHVKRDWDVLKAAGTD